jgi:DNA-binding NtrC family response regulator
VGPAGGMGYNPARGEGAVKDRLKILVVDDEPDVHAVLVAHLERWGYEAESAMRAAAALDLLDRRLFAVALLDIMMPDMDGLALLSEVKRRDLDIDVVMMTGRPSVATAVRALRAGAYHYLEKPLDFDMLQHLLSQIVERRALREEVSDLRTKLGERLRTKELLGRSPAMEGLRELVGKVAGGDSSVLIEGESGTGKELVAASIHSRSARRDKPFVPVNCGAIPGELMESQFFGHVRGSFSGAVADAQGFFRSADGGTIFLDEVAEMSPALQVKLLRVLQDGEVWPVGSAKSYRVDVRMVAATNRRLADAVRAGTFRVDLSYRLDVVRIEVPPLRERKPDIPILAAHFIREFNRRFRREITGLSARALSILTAHDFPGNVRELENLVERAYALGAQGEITEADLPALAPPAQAMGSPDNIPTLVEAERELIGRALRRHDNDRDRAARALGISRRTLYRRLKDYGIDTS